jgi:hypothetical protein
MDASPFAQAGFGLGTVISLLLGMNIWFVRRLVLKIDRLEVMVDQKLPVQQTEIKNMSDKIDSFQKQIIQISNDVKDFGHIRERVAVLEALTKLGKAKFKNDHVT